MLLLDIETAPNIGYTWGLYEQNVIEFIQERFILSFAYKWLGGKTEVFALSKKDVLRQNDKPLILRLHKLLSQAQIVIAQNGDAFDIKRINTRMLFHRIPPPSPYKTIDTLKVARNRFAFNSNKLDDVVKLLGEGEKMKHRGFEMWKLCMAGDRKATNAMKRYNKRDVDILERYYLRIRPWIQRHPCLAVDENLPKCPRCGSSDMQSRGMWFSITTKFRRFQCQACKAWSRGLLGERYTQVASI